MRSTRARSRFAVVAVTVPLIAAGGPLVAPAHAATATVALYAGTIGENNTVGPNAGFRNAVQGVRGNTAVFKIGTEAGSALNNVELKLSGYSTGPAIVPDRDFNPGDGFAVFKDVSAGDNGLGAADGVFGEIDHAQTPVSTGYVASSPSGGQITIRIAIDGQRATGSTGYFVTVRPRPNAGDTDNRDFKLTLPANAIRFSDTSTAPDTAVESPRLTLDSKAPSDVSSGNFTPVSRPPMDRQPSPAKEDAYTVAAAEMNDPDKTLLFLNDGNNVAEANFLKHTDGSPAMHTLPALPGNPVELTIGDGTGITATVKTARNGQVSDDVFVRAFDRLGNFTGAVRLFDNRGQGDNTDRSNDVTAPIFTPGTIDMHDGTNAHRGVNASNQTEAPNRIAYSGTSSTGSPHPNVARAESRMVVTSGGVLSDQPADATPWASVAATNTSPALTKVNTNGVGTTGSLLTIQARLLDAYGNTSDIWKSAAAYTKDTVRPILASVAFVSDKGNDGVGEKGDKVEVRWSEPMTKSAIAETNDTTSQCALAGASCVNQRLVFPAGNISWGVDPTVVWSADLTYITITLGQDPPPSGPDSDARLPKVNDEVQATSANTDAVGNASVSPNDKRFIAPKPPTPNEGAVTTGDISVSDLNLYNQGRDGYLDALTVTFPFPIENHSTAIANNLANFTVIGSSVQKPTSVTVTNSQTFTLSFGGTMTTGEAPRLVYEPPAEGGLRAAGVAVPPFTAFSVDKAAPALQHLSTADTNADGKLDTLIAKYSEVPARAATLLDGGESDTSYSVDGYENHPTGCTVKMNETNTAASATDPTVTEIGLCPGTTPDTAATPKAQTVNDFHPSDTRDPANESATGWSTGSNSSATAFNKVVDKAPPVAVSRTTRDLNNDGRIDAIDVVYGETLDGFSVEFARFTVSNRTITSIDLLGSNGVRLNLAPIAPGVTGDTDSTPTVQYHGGTDNVGLTDASDQRNPVRPDAAPVTPADGAGPAITGACAGTASNNGSCPVDTAADDKIKVFFSEAVDGLAAGEILVEQPAGTNKAVTAVTPASDGKSADLTLANNAIDATKDALVRFSGANVVDDRSAANNGNAQTTAVLAPAAPTVKLDLSCPVSGSTTHCGAAKVNTGAVATTGLVRKWRLSTTAPTTTTPDSEYTTDHPSVYPPSNTTLPEGSLTLYLSGKDDYGRTAGVTPTVSDTITILRAPEIGTVSIVNTTRPATGTWGRSDTIVDGDNINVTAIGYSNDADQWAPGGVCSAARMSIDYRGITANKSLGAVAPFSCSLSTTTFRKSRKMEFPFVKVVGTTRYPVGTVLKQSANDPGWLIVDGPNGTLARRQFVSIGARRSWQITDGSVITVPVSVLNGYPRLSRVGFRDGAVIKTSTSGYYYVYDSIKRPISAGQLNAWKMPLSQTYNVSTGELNAHPTGAGFAYGAHALGTWVRFSDGSIQQITKNRLGQVVRRNVTSSWALRTLVPSAQIYPANHYDRAVPFDATFTRGYRDGVMVKVDATTYGVVSRTVLRTFANSTTFNTMGYNTSNAWPYSASYLPRTAAGHTVGATIDRYKISSVVVKVTNLAGDSASKVVLPTVGGLWAVGTLDPIPANWDSSRK